MFSLKENTKYFLNGSLNNDSVKSLAKSQFFNFNNNSVNRRKIIYNFPLTSRNSVKSTFNNLFAKKLKNFAYLKKISRPNHDSVHKIIKETYEWFLKNYPNVE